MDNRHTNRLHIVQNLFALTFLGDETKRTLPNETETKAVEIQKNLSEIDRLIEKHAPKYPLDKIAKIDICILRLAVYELFIHPTEPVKVVINEAIELAKELGSERSYAFVNAVLGSVHKEISDNKNL